MTAAELLKLREQQILEKDRIAEDDYDHPINHAEGGPNRFAIMSMFFTDTDGVQIQEDLDLNEITIKYFTDDESIELTEGPMYNWALDMYKTDSF